MLTDTGKGKSFWAVFSALLALNACQKYIAPPILLECYQSRYLQFHIAKDKIIIKNGHAVHFDILKKKIGWVISVPLRLIESEKNQYLLIMSSIGDYNWTVSGSGNTSVITIISQNGSPLYFKKCLTDAPNHK